MNVVVNHGVNITVMETTQTPEQETNKMKDGKQMLTSGEDDITGLYILDSCIYVLPHL